ncbi:hypothetical protein [Kitasatospora sp. NPDC093558]|uniref:terpene synthase family protein n=1 Tax=Kitasatospora sp. NPDC093558 TaxID=3155201 RepID=UPI003421DC59
MTVRYGADFTTPWPLQDNPHVDQARAAAVDWLQAFGLLRDRESVDDFTAWRLTEVAGWFYPHATAEDCATAAQMMGWYFLPFDDQLDGGIGRSPREVAGIARTLIAVLHGEPVPTGMRCPTITAFADLWGRMTRGMSAPLRERVRYHWSSYFSSQVTEALDRRAGYAYTDLESYFAFRAETSCAFGLHDLAEVWGGTELPAHLWHHPALARMRQLGADLVAIRNDSMSLPHEDVDGLHNTIHIVERAYSCTRQQAVERASAFAEDKVARIVALEERALPRLLQALDDHQRSAVAGYTETIHNWVVGDYEWERMSTRNEQHRPMPEWATTLLATDRAW